MLWIVRELLGSTPALVLAALAPALGWIGLLLIADRRSRSRGTALGAVLWGAAVAAPLASRINETGRLGLLLGAPVVEEALKIAPLVLLALLRSSELAGARDGIVLGAFVGIGFALTENIQYVTLAAVQGGTAGLARAVYLRGVVEGMNHAIFTASLGAGIGGARTAGGWIRLTAPLLGALAAVGQHAVWNAVASGLVTRVLCNAAREGGPCREPDALVVFLAAPLIAAVAMGPGALLLLAIALRAQREPRARPMRQPPA